MSEYIPKAGEVCLYTDDMKKTETKILAIHPGGQCEWIMTDGIEKRTCPLVLPERYSEQRVYFKDGASRVRFSNDVGPVNSIDKIKGGE